MRYAAFPWNTFAMRKHWADRYNVLVQTRFIPRKTGSMTEVLNWKTSLAHICLDQASGRWLSAARIICRLENT